MSLLQLVERRDRTVEEAQADLATIETLVRDQRGLADRAKAEAERLRADAGRVAIDAALADDPTLSADHRGRLTDALAEEAMAEGGLETAEAAKPRAVANLHRAQAKAWRDEAALLRAQVDRRRKKTDRLLAQLREHEECDYVPSRADRRPVEIGPAGPVPLPGSDGWRDPLTGGRVSGPLNPFFDVVEITLPKTTMLRDDADDLETRATAAEREAARLDPDPAS